MLAGDERRKSLGNELVIVDAEDSDRVGHGLVIIGRAATEPDGAFA